MFLFMIFMLFGNDDVNGICCTYEASSYMVADSPKHAKSNALGLQYLIDSTPDTAITIDLDGVGVEYYIDLSDIGAIYARKPITLYSYSHQNSIKLVNRNYSDSNNVLFYFDLNNWATLNCFIYFDNIVVYADNFVPVTVLKLAGNSQNIDNININFVNCWFQNVYKAFDVRLNQQEFYFSVRDSRFETKRNYLIYTESTDSIVTFINTINLPLME